MAKKKESIWTYIIAIAVVLVVLCSIMIFSPGIFVTSLINALFGFGLGLSWLLTILFSGSLFFFLFRKNKEKAHIHYLGIAFVIFIVLFIYNYMVSDNIYMKTVITMYPFLE